MASRTYYVLREDNCRFESMTKEQILTAITQAVENHQVANVDTGFVTTVKEQNHNVGLKFWLGTQAEYNQITSPEDNCFYIISDDQSYQDIKTQLDNISSSVSGLVTQADKKDYLISAREIAVGTSSGTIAGIENFRLVEVDGCLCNVYKRGTNKYSIRGYAPIQTVDGTFVLSTRLLIEIDVDVETETIVNSSYTETFKHSESEPFGWSYTTHSVNRILGVM